MAYDPMYDDDEAQVAMLTGQYPAPRAPSPLASAVPSPAVPRAPLNFAASLPPAYKPYFDAEAAKNAALKTEVYDPQRKRLEDYTKELKARRAGPTSAERLYDIGAALMRPTATPGFGGMIANVAPVMAAQRKARREAEDAQRELALKYDLEIGNIGDEEAKGRISGQSALMKSIIAAQLKAGKGAQPMRAVVDQQGNAHHPSLGYILPTIGSRPGQVPIEAVQTMLSVNTPAMDAEFDRKYNSPGYSKLLRDYQGSTNAAPDASPYAASED